ncbi:hypothetical protein ACF0H5_001172 [Mactra antiquata]
MSGGGKQYLSVPDKSRDAASYLMSRFMTRPDVKTKKLPEFIDWTMKSLDNADYSTMIGCTNLSGQLATLGLIFKHGKREDLLHYAPTVLKKLEKLNLAQCNNSVLRKYGVKVVQRLGLTFLKSRVAKWRYQRGNRSLADNLQLSKEAVTERATTSNTVIPSSNDAADDDDEYDIPDEIEEVIASPKTLYKDCSY